MIKRQPARSSETQASSLRSVRRTSRPNGLRPRGRGRRQGSGEPDGWTRHQRRWRYVTLSADATTSGSATRTSRRTCSCTTGSPGRSTSAMRDLEARVGDLAGTGEVGDVPAGVYGSGLGSSEHRLAYLVPRRTLEGAGIPRARSAPFPQHEASDGRRLEIRRATVASRVDIRHRRLQRTTGHATPGTLPPHANALSPHGVREANILFSAKSDAAARRMFGVLLTLRSRPGACGDHRAGRSAVGGSRGHTAVGGLDAEHRRRPAVLVVAPCGFHLDGVVSQAWEFRHRMPAVPVWAIDADRIVGGPARVWLTGRGTSGTGRAGRTSAVP